MEPPGVALPMTVSHLPDGFYRLFQRFKLLILVMQVMSSIHSIPLTNLTVVNELDDGHDKLTRCKLMPSDYGNRFRNTSTATSQLPPRECPKDSRFPK